MPDGSLISPERTSTYNAEDRAHRLHALVWVIAELELDGTFRNGGDEAENARGNLLRLAREESTALLATRGFC